MYEDPGINLLEMFQNSVKIQQSAVNVLFTASCAFSTYDFVRQWNCTLIAFFLILSRICRLLS